MEIGMVKPSLPFINLGLVSTSNKDCTGLGPPSKTNSACQRSSSLRKKGLECEQGLDDSQIHTHFN